MVRYKGGIMEEVKQECEHIEVYVEQNGNGYVERCVECGNTVDRQLPE